MNNIFNISYHQYFNDSEIYMYSNYQYEATKKNLP